MNLKSMAGFLKSPETKTTKTLQGVTVGNDTTGKPDGVETKETPNGKETTISVSGSLKEAKEKALKLARDMGADEETLKQLESIIEEKENEFLSGKKSFGVYAHPPILGVGSEELANSLMETIVQKYRDNPEATVEVRLEDILNGLKVFKGAFDKATRLNLESEVKTTEMGIMLMYCIAGFKGEGITPTKVLQRMAALWSGKGPGELDFKPVYDEDYPGISAAWLAYKNGEIDAKEYQARVVKVRPAFSVKGGQRLTPEDEKVLCDCPDCKADRGESEET